MWYVVIFCLISISSSFERFNCYIYLDGLKDPQFNVSKVSGLCTHVTIAWALVNEGVMVDVPSQDLVAYDKLNLFKQDGAKVMVAVPGYDDDGQGTYEMSKMAMTREGRESFVKSLIEFLYRHNLDGVVIDWRFPGIGSGGGGKDKGNFSQLIALLKRLFLKTGHILGAHVGVKPEHDSSYDIPYILTYLDFVDMHTFNYFGGWESKAGHNAPLYAHPNNTNRRRDNVNSSVSYWLAKTQSSSSSKLSLGIPAFGWNQLLIDPKQVMPFADTLGGGGGTVGVVAYTDYCRLENHTQYWFYNWNAPVSVRDQQWIQGENIISVRKKVDFARDKNLGGIFLWTLNWDDPTGVCEDTFPLTRAIRGAMGRLENAVYSDIDYDYDISKFFPTTSADVPTYFSMTTILLAIIIVLLAICVLLVILFLRKRAIPKVQDGSKMTNIYDPVDYGNADGISLYEEIKMDYKSSADRQSVANEYMTIHGSGINVSLNSNMTNEDYDDVA
ncbi:Acidic mammalian chitinase [Halotydeus destructor]|nr:Acidic mammalian chitinase [Halotydeus destructor]